MIVIIVTAFNAIAPMILLIGLGYVLKQVGFFDKSFLSTGNKLVFKVCLPAMLFVNVYDVENLQQMNWPVVLYCIMMTLILFLLGFVVAIAVTKVPSRRGVLLQCTFRSNFAIIGLSLASALGGAKAAANASVISAATIPLFNILAVVALSVFVETERSENRLKSVLKNIVKNPLIWGVLLGMVCVLIRQIQQNLFGAVVFSLKHQLGFIYDVLCKLKSVTTPLALLVLGGQFEFSAVKGLRREIVVGTLMRTVFAPVFGIGTAVMLSRVTSSFHCDPSMYPALIALFGSPVAVSSAIMAEAMGSDKQLAAQLVVWTSLASIVTVFMQVCLLMYFGLLVI